MNATLKLLLSSKDNIILNTQLAVEIGLNEAIVLRQVFYWVEHYETEKKNFKDGKYWVYNSMKQWRSDNFPFMSEKTIERAFKTLREKELILVGDYSSDRMKRPNWYTINEKKFEKLMKKIMGIEDNSNEKEEENEEPDETRETECPNRVRQNVGMQSDTPTDCYNIYNNINNNDTENTNRDYSTENTDNSFSTEKDNSKQSLDIYNSEVSELRTPTPETADGETDKPKSNITMTLGRRDRPSKKHELQDMPTRAKEIAYQFMQDDELSDKAFELVQYFMDYYKACNGTDHLNLTDPVLKRVVWTMLNTLTVPIETETEYFENDYYPLIDREIDIEDSMAVVKQYFETDFNYRVNGKRVPVKKSLVHFTETGVLTKIMNKCDLNGGHWHESHEID